MVRTVSLYIGKIRTSKEKKSSFSTFFLLIFLFSVSTGLQSTVASRGTFCVQQQAEAEVAAEIIDAIGMFKFAAPITLNSRERHSANCVCTCDCFGSTAPPEKGEG